MFQLIQQLLERMGIEGKEVTEDHVTTFTYKNKRLIRYCGVTVAPTPKDYNVDKVTDTYLYAADAISRTFDEMGVDKNREVILLMEAEDIADPHLNRIVLDTHIDAYTCSKTIVLFNQKQVELLELFLQKSENLKGDILSTLVDKSYVEELEGGEWTDKALLFDILSKLHASLDLFPLFENKDVPMIRSITFDDTCYNLNCNKLFVGGNKSIILDVLEGKTELFHYFYPKGTVSIEVQTEEGKETIQYSEGKLTGFSIGEESTRVTQLEGIKGLFYLVSLKTFGVGMFPFRLDSGQFLARSKVEIANDYLMENNRMELIQYIILVLLAVQDKNSPFVYLNLKEFPDPDKALKFIDWIAQMPYLFIFNHAERHTDQMYFRYKLTKSRSKVETLR